MIAQLSSLSCTTFSLSNCESRINQVNELLAYSQLENNASSQEIYQPPNNNLQCSKPMSNFSSNNTFQQSLAEQQKQFQQEQQNSYQHQRYHQQHNQWLNYHDQHLQQYEYEQQLQFREHQKNQQQWQHPHSQKQQQQWQLQQQHQWKRQQQIISINYSKKKSILKHPSTQRFVGKNKTKRNIQFRKKLESIRYITMRKRRLIYRKRKSKKCLLSVPRGRNKSKRFISRQKKVIIAKANNSNQRTKNNVDNHRYQLARYLITNTTRYQLNRNHVTENTRYQLNKKQS